MKEWTILPEEMMTPRERWLAVLQGRKPDRIPMDYWATGEANAKLMEHMECGSMDEVFEVLHIDNPVSVGGKYTGPSPPDGEDIFGCRFKDVEYGTGVYREVVHNPLSEFESVEEIEKNYEWPDPDWWGYSDVPGQLKGMEDRPRV